MTFIYHYNSNCDEKDRQRREISRLNDEKYNLERTIKDYKKDFEELKKENEALYKQLSEKN